MIRVHDPQGLGIMAHLIEISTIWGDMLATISRSAHQSPKSYLVGYTQLYEDISHRLAAWLTDLPSSLQLTAKNTLSSVVGGYAGTFVSMYSYYHITGMILNRRVRHNLLPPDLIHRNLLKAVHHADQLLLTMQVLLEASTSNLASPQHPSSPALPLCLSTPFPGYAILNAIDILSSAGSLQPTSLRDNLHTWEPGLAIVSQLAGFWASAQRQWQQITQRIEAIVSGAIAHEGQGLRVWIVKRPMEMPPLGNSADQDIFYTHDSGLDDRNIVRSHSALEADVKERDILYVEDASRRKGSQDSGASPSCDTSDAVRLRIEREDTESRV